MNLPPLPAHVVDAFWERWGGGSFLSAQGLEIELAGEGRAIVHLRSPSAAQRGGGGSDAVLNGGVIAYMFDGALGSSITTASLARPEMREIDPLAYAQSTINLDITYVRAATGARFAAHGKVVNAGRNVAFAEGELLDDQGRVCATAKGIWRVFWPRRTT
ncbi:MAG TPA: PaaI family thioesterase [Rubrivivax sp.]|nr:PaaI family thioesterase [Rubrivivax sp.]